MKIYKQIISGLILSVSFAATSNAQTSNITLNTYSGQSTITASQSITLTPPFFIPSGSNVRIYIGTVTYPVLVSHPTANQNYIISSAIRKSGVTALSQMPLLHSNEISQQIQYLDGLGRPVQTVAVAASPAGNDIIQPVVYDAFGRENIKYQPYIAATGNNGQLRTPALTEQSSFYNTPPAGIKSTAYPYAETVFEASPLNRVEQQGAPGASWQISQGHTQKLAYVTNTAQGGSYAAKLYRALAAGTGFQRTLSDGGWYGAGELYVTVQKDENWTAASGQAGTVEEYKNKQDQVVLKRTFNKKADNSIETLSTYYVYDDFGKLSFVLPPGSEADSALPNLTALNNFCYQYSYDGRGRLIEKKVPGAGTVIMVYNNHDQLVLSQDAGQQSRQEWNFIRYDALDRIIMSGVYTSSGSRASLQTVIDNETVLPDHRNNALTYGYTTSCYPSTGFSPRIINYYDDYDFPGNTFGQPVAGQVSGDYVNGQLTGTKVWTLEVTPKILLSVNYYNDDSRLVQLKSVNHLGGTDISAYSYDFTGELLTTTRTNTVNSVVTTIANRYEYDQAGRKLKTWEQINSGAEVLLSENIYNELGQLMQKKLHDGLQSSTYAYNERGWPKSSSSTQFSESLKYEDGTTPQYNGNIANQSWGTGTTLPNTFTYSYDKLNRLISGNSTGILMSEALSYDKMGNIKTMSRDVGAAGTYNYTGNRLTNITTGPLATGTYAYDAGGNVTTDGRTGTTLTYNSLNLPVTVAKTGLALAYLYDAAGNKLRKTVNGSTRDYIGGIEYNGSTIDLIHTEEGVARNNGGTYSYEYTLSDHLGNNRATFYKNPSTGSLEVLQRDNYYAFGLRKQNLAASNDNKYLYNSKELQPETGDYDYGARFYDPVIGRWNVMDPMSENYLASTPYNYVLNNPLANIDPNGMEVDTRYVNPLGQTIFNSDDGRNDVFEVSWDRVNDFKNLINSSNSEALNSQSFNDYWRDQFTQTISGATLDKAGFNSLSSEKVKSAAIEYLYGSRSYGSFVSQEVMAQWSNPVNVAMGLTAFVHGAVGVVDGLSAAKGGSTALTKFYPANNGFLGATEGTLLMPGEQISRYGSISGKFFSPDGTPLPMRALPPGSNTSIFNTYKVLKPFEVQAGKIAPAFGQPGLGVQYLSPISVDILLKRGIIGH